MAGERSFTIFADDFYGPGAAVIGGPWMWVDPALEDDHGGWNPGTYSGYVPLHEIGHILGLSHPHDYGSAATMLISSMSYIYVQASDGRYLYPEEPGVLDIVLLGEVYGYNTSTAGDGTVHVVTKSDRLNTVWDYSGDHDLVDLSRLTDGCIVDLGGGLVDTSHGYVVLSGIKDVTLGRGADVVVLAGGERIYGLALNDLLIGDGASLHKLDKGERKAESLKGKWYEVDGALVAWKGSEASLEGLVIMAEGSAS